MRIYSNVIHIGHPGCFYLDGEWCPPREQQDYALVDPSTEMRHDGFSLGGLEDADAAVAAARRAFDEGPWPTMDPRKRSELIGALADALEARRLELEEAWTLQMGATTRMRAKAIDNGINHFRRAEQQVDSFAFERAESSAAGEAIIRYEPVGVVAAIAAWNGPLLQMASKVGPALAAGCTVVMKPAAQTPIEAIIIAECAQAVGIPNGVLNFILLDRSGADKLIADTRVDKVSFTGSTEVGRHIARVCGDRIARYTLELGGKSAAIVLDDVDVADVGKIMGRTITALSGQLCTMLSRVIVLEDRHDALAEAIAAEMARVKIGDSRDPATEMGPLASPRQLVNVQQYVDKARQEGARLIYGGRRPSHLDRGFFHEPTLFCDVASHDAIAQEEIFGPVLSLIKAKDEDDAVRIANDSIYGLHGSVFTRDRDRARSIARRVRTGSFGQNGMKLDFALPFGGYKQSGIGREGGADAMVPYLEIKTILLDK
ncbi:aldehyde dehydrogenase family protein [Paraburkholderia sediminicola]|uniref:aldehyde dehydrogenase family protein n=1 Tax=Paraburkholderia sediminicola TaxID=458836 RepID=UPI000E71A445